MVKHGLLVHTPGQGYTLGPLSVRLGLLALDRLPLIDRADPVMRKLSETVHETSTLSVWGGSGPLVARVHDEQSQVHPHLGRGRLDAAHDHRAGTALPRAPRDERSLRRATPAGGVRTRCPPRPRSCDTAEPLAFSDASADGLRCVAAPIYRPDGSLVATLALMERFVASPTTRRRPGRRTRPGRRQPVHRLTRTRTMVCLASARALTPRPGVAPEFLTAVMAGWWGGAWEPGPGRDPGRPPKANERAGWCRAASGPIVLQRNRRTEPLPRHFHRR